TESDTKSLIASGKIKLRPKTFTDEDIDFLLEGDNLFARKFNDIIDNKIIDSMESSFDLPLNKAKQIIMPAANTGFALVGGQCEYKHLSNCAGRQLSVPKAHQRKARERSEQCY
ncbi:MAG: hypothetical protein Q7J05_08640, partial [Paludibacter sp.]|nr:hypothetical protein [Paludibacter sp.]